MTKENETRFDNVTMPRWYGIAAWTCRILGLATAVGGLLSFVYLSKMESAEWFYCFFIGLILLVLPSLPKASIEQWNRINGRRDGSLLADVTEKRDKES